MDCSPSGSSVHGISQARILEKVAISSSRGLFPAQGLKLLCLWDSPGKNTGVGCHALLQGIFLTQGSNLPLLKLLHCRRILYRWAAREAYICAYYCLNFNKQRSWLLQNHHINSWAPQSQAWGNLTLMFSALCKSQTVLDGHHCPPILLFGVCASLWAARLVPWFIEAWLCLKLRQLEWRFQMCQEVFEPNSFSTNLKTGYKNRPYWGSLTCDKAFLAGSRNKSVVAFLFKKSALMSLWYGFPFKAAF